MPAGFFFSLFSRLCPFVHAAIIITIVAYNCFPKVVQFVQAWGVLFQDVELRAFQRAHFFLYNVRTLPNRANCHWEGRSPWEPEIWNVFWVKRSEVVWPNAAAGEKKVCNDQRPWKGKLMLANPGWSFFFFLMRWVSLLFTARGDLEGSLTSMDRSNPLCFG